VNVKEKENCKRHASRVRWLLGEGGGINSINSAKNSKFYVLIFNALYKF
jgi:hypothetical protein